MQIEPRKTFILFFSHLGACISTKEKMGKCLARDENWSGNN